MSRVVKALVGIRLFSLREQNYLNGDSLAESELDGLSFIIINSSEIQYNKCIITIKLIKKFINSKIHVNMKLIYGLTIVLF